MVCLTLELVGSWVELGFSVVMEPFGLDVHSKTWEDRDKLRLYC